MNKQESFCRQIINFAYLQAERNYEPPQELVGYYADLCLLTDFNPAAIEIFREVMDAYYHGGFIQKSTLVVGPVQFNIPTKFHPREKIPLF